MAKFKVGDLVIGNSKASNVYTFTIRGWVGKVEAVGEDGYFNAGGYPGLHEDFFDFYVRKTGIGKVIDEIVKELE